ncbi:MAG: LuxR C-terminal-related transcriptional regulator, partial [Anaerolineae bacterium]
WLSIDDNDNDPVRFLAYLTAALRTVGAVVDAETQGAWHSVEGPGTEALLTTLLNQVSALPDHVLLVLDDYHLITNETVHKALSFLVRHLPDTMHVVLATRADPPLQLSRLRARGQLVELRQNDLRFTAEEAATFLNKAMNLDLSADDVAALERRTEGWIAGLQMAALALGSQGTQPESPVLHEPRPGSGARRPPRRGYAELSAFVSAFTGSHRFILDYLVEEVLDRQPAELQQFLLRTSILERMTAPLCDHILGEDPAQPKAGEAEGGQAGASSALAQSKSQARLEQLETANLFIVPMDDERRWYRYHRLFSDLLRKRLRQTHPEQISGLYQRASEWCEQNGHQSEAIDYALWQGDMIRAANLIEEAAEETLMRSEVTTLLRWLDRLPDQEVRARPLLCTFHAWALLLSGRPWEEVKTRLADIACAPDATSSPTDQLPAEVAAIRSYVALVQGDIIQATNLARSALAQLPEDDRLLRGIAQWSLGMSSLADSDPQAREEALEETARLSQESGNVMVTVMVLCNLAELQIKKGQLHQAQRIYQRALQTAVDREGRPLPIAAQPLVGLASLAYQENKLDEAMSYLQDALGQTGTWSAGQHVEGNIVLSRVRQALGDEEGARQAAAKARTYAIQFDVTDLDDVAVEWQQARLWIAQGNIDAARRWADKRQLNAAVPEGTLSESEALLRSHMLKYEQVILGRLLVAEGKMEEALAILGPLAQRMEERKRLDLAIESYVLAALAFQATGDSDGALDALGRALTLAAPGGHIRMFMDEGLPMAALLKQAASRGIMAQYASQLLTAFDTHTTSPDSAHLEPSPQPLIDPLSEREMDVLRLLPTGMSNPEIADHLYIAVSTVRSHLKSIYSKLNVHKRWDAVQRAKESGLL